MKTIPRNGLAVILGVVFGSVANMALVLGGPLVVPPPTAQQRGNPAAEARVGRGCGRFLA
jgi:hypothetical protein